MNFKSFNNRTIKRRLAYVLMPIFFAIIGIGVTLAVVLPIYNDFSNIVGMITSDSAPDFNDELSSIFEGASPVVDTVDNADVVIPDFNCQYGKLTCKALDINAPLYYGDSDLALKYGVGQFAGSYMPGFGGVILVAGHNTTFFYNFRNVQVGNVFTISTNYGKFKYKCYKIEPHEFNDMKAVNYRQNREELIMYTCYPFRKMAGVKTQRLFVYCEKISGPRVVGVYDEY